MDWRGEKRVEFSLGATMPVMLSQIAAMFLMMAVGAACYKARFIPDDGAKALANLTCYVSTPAVIIRALAIDFDPEILGNLIAVALLTCVLTAASILVAHLAYGFNGNRVAQMGIIISNVGFMGIPLVEHVVGEEYVIYVSTLIAAQTVIVWTYCVWFFTRDRSMVSLKKVATNPVIVSVALGAVMFIFSIKLSGPFESFVDGMANLNTGLGMLLLGIYLAQSDLRSLVRTKSIYKASFLRLIAASAVSIAVIVVWPMPIACKVAMLISFVTPCGATASIFAQLFGGDYRFGAGLATISTLLSLVTMPIMLMAGMALL